MISPFVSVERTATGKFKVRWREGGRARSRTFDLRRDAVRFDAEIRRRMQARGLPALDAGGETLSRYVTEQWAATHAALLSRKTRAGYAGLLDYHILPSLGHVPLRDLRPASLTRWQRDRLAAGGGPVAVAKALTLLGGILQRAVEDERIPANPARAVRRTALPPRREVRPLAPVDVEAVRRRLGQRDATLVVLLAYAGLRPGEALALRWADVRERTLLVHHAVSLGRIAPTKTRRSRTVRLPAPLASDLRAWRLQSDCPTDDALVIPGVDDRPWTQAAYQSWRRRTFNSAVRASGLPPTQ
jgi:integrase